MQKKLLTTLLASIGACATLLSFPAGADDIDIFTGASAGKKGNPNILIVLDNTANWAKASQKWPDYPDQGKSEVAAIMSAVDGLDDSVNVGLFEYTGGTAENDGGYVRFAIQAMTDTNKYNLQQKLGKIFADVNAPEEKRSAGTPYGNLIYDVYNYFSGSDVYSLNGELKSYDKDPAGYSDQWNTFKSPLSAATSCANTFVILVTNPQNNGPTKDSDANSSKLNSLGGDAVHQLQLPNFTSKTVDVVTTLGQTNLCYADPVSAKVELNAAPWSTTCVTSNFSKGCSIGSALNDGSKTCPSGQASYAILGTNSETTNVAVTGGEHNDIKPFNLDEWARFMHDKGVPIPGTDPVQRSNVTFYTIDVYNVQQDVDHTSLMLSTAKAGGGKYFAAKSQKAIVDALKQILGEIQAVNSTFASTSLPVNSTNRSQNENQVFIGMFRPDKKAKPRWFGNLKRYKLIPVGSDIKLGDASDPVKQAVDEGTGFITDCAVSYWTKPSGTYWQNLNLDPDPKGKCPDQLPYSDSPDGPLVEKGGAAQVLRNGNNPPTTSDTPTYAVNRKIYTRGSTGTLVEFNTTTSGLSSDLVNFIKGADVNNERPAGGPDKTRPSIHGDVIHSRPLPLNYGTNKGGVFVFYGANDGYFRAVEADTGKERWAFIAPEFFGRLQRLKDQTPLVNYPNVGGTGDVASIGAPKDYFFDGSTGYFQNIDSSSVWVFPSMRRGGRMIYGLNVSDMDAPSLMWKAGCPNLGNDTGCTDGMTGIGQTWSTPVVAFIKGYPTGGDPVLIFGGGYDKCEDENTGAPTCTSGKGGYVYILNARTGELLRSFPTRRSVAADVSVVDIDGDGKIDYAYAADTGGNVYRIDFIDGPTNKTELTKENWQIYRVAYTNDSSNPRKFLFGPALLYNKGFVYVALGSGDREHPLGWQYPYNGVRNRFYVALDNLSIQPTTDTMAINLDTAMTDSTEPTTCNSPKTLPGGSSKGWFMQLAKGEQVVTSALIAGGTVTFSTNRPIVDDTASCATSLGEARGYMVNLLNASGAVSVDGTCGGTRSSKFAGGGLPPSPVLATGVPIDMGNGVIVRRDIEIGSPKSPSPIGSTKIPPPIKSERKRKYTYVKGQ